MVFAAGMSVTFTVLGTAASLLGRLMQGTGSWWYILLGVLMFLMALQIWGIFDFIPSTYAISKSSKRGFLGAFLAGVLGGFFSSPCATPVLIVLLAIVAKEGSLFVGVLLLLLYSIGHSVLVLIAGTSVGFVQKVLANERYGIVTKGFKMAMGIIILLIAFYMFYLGF
jgi:cytochrome c biogenesis protein CcdA